MGVESNSEWKIIEINILNLLTPSKIGSKFRNPGQPPCALSIVTNFP